MKTYFQNGTVKDVSAFLDNDSKFFIQEVDGNDRYTYPGDGLKYELDNELVCLYDKVRDLFFENTDEYHSELNTIPTFVQEAGQSSDCNLTSELFAELLENENVKKIPNIYRHLYLVDCQFLIGTVQNLINGMEAAFIDYYKSLSSMRILAKPIETNATICVMSQDVSNTTALLENYFIKAYSILDMLCKIGYEFQYIQQDFSAYKKLKSADVLWGDRKKLSVNNTQSTVFEKCDLVSAIETLRNEVIHNGSWELNPKAFIVYKDGHITERYMMFPDIIQRHLATVKNRRHFFGFGYKVNDVFPLIHQEYRRRILSTVKWLN